MTQTPPKRFVKAGGLLFILAGITFWLGWFLMPDAGTNDAAHILQLVSTHRQNVWLSVLTHILCSILLAIGVIGIQTDARMSRSKTTRWGASLVSLGAVGVCLDAFFHLIAYYMTTDGVPQKAMAAPMALIQTQGIKFLIPFLLAFIIGGTVYTAGFYHVGATSVWPKRVLLAGLAWALIGGLIAAKLGTGHQLVTLGFLSWISLGYIWGGFEVAFKLKAEQSPS